MTITTKNAFDIGWYIVRVYSKHWHIGLALLNEFVINNFVTIINIKRYITRKDYMINTTTMLVDTKYQYHDNIELVTTIFNEFWDLKATRCGKYHMNQCVITNQAKNLFSTTVYNANIKS